MGFPGAFQAQSRDIRAFPLAESTFFKLNQGSSALINPHQLFLFLSMTIREQREMGKRGRLRSELIEQEMVNAIRLHPDFSMPQIQEILALPRSTFYRILAKLKANGVIAK